jgi:heptosyltransferase-1
VTQLSPDLSARSFERILLVKPSSLGDVVHALPVLHGLRARYPDARIDWLVAPPFASLIEHHSDLSGTVLFDRGRFGRIGRSAKVTGEFRAFLRELRAARYDLVLDLQGLFRTGFMTWATRSPVRIGFREAREGAWVFYNRYIPRLEDDAHAVDRNYRVATVLGFADVPVSFDLALTSRTRREAAELLGGADSRRDGPLIAMAPGARWETKVWPADRFAAVSDRLNTAVKARCVLLGSPDEAALCARIAELCASAPINLAGRTALPQMAAILAHSDSVLCHDSAAMHVAVALNRPLVCLTGPTNPRRTGPYRRLEDVVRLDLDCSPCYLRRLAQCPHAHRCMKDLSVDAVAKAVERSLKRGQSGGA